MRPWFASLALTLLLLQTLTAPAGAQAEIRLSAAEVQIWPEYDRAAVLVIHRLTLAPETVLPVRLELPIPARAQVNAVAYLDESRGLLVASYDRTVDGDKAVLAISANSLQVQVEYYDPLEVSGSRRRIAYEWAGLAVERLEVEFLEPDGATDLHIRPEPVETTAGAEGLPNHRLAAVSLAAGEGFLVAIDYQRTSDSLTVANLPVEAVATPGPDTPGRVSMTGLLPWLLAGLGILLLAVGGAAVVSWKSGNRPPTRRHRSAPRRPAPEAASYCPQCGKRAQAGDSFCRTCGARLPREE